MGYVTYDSNNSGGNWWLKESDWDALEMAGWNVHWKQGDGWGNDGTPSNYGGKEEALRKVEKGKASFLGALATSAAKETDDLRAAVEEFESVTGQNVADQGCNCCGPPHSFSLYDDEGNHVDSPSVRIEEYLVW